MSKNVVVISTSLRGGSNSEALAQQFADGAKAAGNQVELISLKGKKLSFCTGCVSCKTTGECVIKDDANAITEKVLNADVVAWATPVYYYEMTGQMKTLIDRMNSMFRKDYKFRDVYALITAAEDEPETPLRTISGIMGWVECFGKTSLKGTVFCGGVNDPGDIRGNKKLEEAFEMGKNV